MHKLNPNDDSYLSYQTWKQWNRKAFGEFSAKDHFYFSKLWSQLRIPSSNLKSLKILELGFGNGSFAGWLKVTHPQTQWTGVEIQQPLIEKARDAGFDVHLTIPEPTPENRYDIIVALDVIEHLTDSEISDFFTQATGLLKKRGLIVIRTPNAGGPFGLPNQVGDPTHKTPISRPRLSSYLRGWVIHETGDIQPVWEGKVFSAIRNLIRLALRAAISSMFRFAFAPQPSTLLAKNIHLIFRSKD